MSPKPSRFLSFGLWLLGRFEDRQSNYGLFGDIEEMYHHMAVDSRLKANFWLTAHLLRLLPAMWMDRLFWAIVMVKNYGKLALRNMAKDRMATFINIAGLSVAVGCSLVAFLFVDFYYGRDTNHENYQQIFMVGNVIQDQDSQQLWGDSPEPLGPALLADFPQVERAVRVADVRGIVRYKDKVFHESIRFVDDGFLEMFTYPLKYGEKNAFGDRNSIILSEDLAEKYFGRRNPVGEQVTIQFRDNYKETFLVRGVTEEFHKNASFWFDILIPFEKQLDLGIQDFLQWDRLVAATFIQLENPQDITIIEARLDKYLALQNAASTERPMSAFFLEPLLQMSRNAYNTRRTLVWVELYPGQLYSMYFGGLFLILQACFNYMNIAIVASTRRFKEIAVRKILGSNKKQLVLQFLGENLFLCAIALIVGIFLGRGLFVPGFNNLWGVFHFDVNIFGNLRLVLYLVALLALTGIGAGLYPAFYIAAYEPVNILRKKQKIRGNNWFVKGLLTFQFICAIMSVSNGIIFIQNHHYQRDRDWGYDQAQRLVLPVEEEKQFVQMRDLIQEESSVINLAGTVHHIGRGTARAGIQVLEKSYDVVRFDVGFDYFETMGLRLKEGRAFRQESPQDKIESILVNETFVRDMHWDNAIGQKVMLHDQPAYVIGVVHDFHYDTFMNKIEPVVMTVTDESQCNYLTMLVQPGTATLTMSRLKSHWHSRFPDSPFMGFYQDEIFDHYKQMMGAVAKSSSVMAMIALLITCMGILGLVSMDISKRMKEISIRKVLGASSITIASLINQGFLRLILIASMVAIPSSYFLINMFLDALWKYHRDLDYTPFAISLALVFLAALITIISKIYKALVVNPVVYLRDE